MDNQQWNWFLTPSTTPTDPIFSPTSSVSMHTPGTDPGSHFQEAFNSSMPTSQQTPHSILAPSPFPDSQCRSSDSVNNTSVPSSQSSQICFSSSSSIASSAAYSSNAKTQSGQPTDNSSDTSQVRTPPPTRRQSIKRRSVRKQPTTSNELQTSMPPGGLTTEAAAAWLQHQSLPTSFSQPNLGLISSQFGPFNDPMQSDMSLDQASSFSNRYPDQLSSQTHQPLGQLNNGHPFNVFGGPLPAQPFPFNMQCDPTTGQPLLQRSLNNEGHMSASQPHMHGFAPQETPFHNGFTSDAMPGSATVQRPSVGKHMHASGVNPSLVYTSPGRLAQASVQQGRRPSTRPQIHVKTDPMYLQAARPMTSGRQTRPQNVQNHQRTQTECQPFQQLSARPGLRRSNTTSGASTTSSHESLSRSNSTTNISRRGSPLKSFVRNSINSLSSIAEATKGLPRSRTAVVLTVDSDGRARTETRPLDESPSKLLKIRYPSLYDGSDSESDSDQSSFRNTGRDASIASSRASSTRAMTPRRDKASDDAFRLARSNSSASIRNTPSRPSYVTASSLRRTGSVKKPTHQSLREKRHSMASLASLTGSLADLPLSPHDDKDDEKENGDAGAALRKAMEQRNSRRDLGDSFSARMIAQPRRQSQASSRPGLPARTTSLQNLSTTGLNTLNTAVSPMNMTQPSLLTPFDSSPIKSPTDSLSSSMMMMSSSMTGPPASLNTSAPLTRCICNMSFTEGQHMIQCTACHLWLHSACLGLSALHAPQHYVCTFCCPPNPSALDNFMPYMANWDLAAAV